MKLKKNNCVEKNKTVPSAEVATSGIPRSHSPGSPWHQSLVFAVVASEAELGNALWQYRQISGRGEEGPLIGPPAAERHELPGEEAKAAEAQDRRKHQRAAVGVLAAVQL